MGGPIQVKVGFEGGIAAAADEGTKTVAAVFRDEMEEAFANTVLVVVKQEALDEDSVVVGVATDINVATGVTIEEGIGGPSQEKDGIDDGGTAGVPG